VCYLQSRIRRISGLLFSLLEGQNDADITAGDAEKMSFENEAFEAGVEFWEIQMDFRSEGVTLYTM